MGASGISHVAVLSYPRLVTCRDGRLPSRDADAAARSRLLHTISFRDAMRACEPPSPLIPTLSRSCDGVCASMSFEEALNDAIRSGVADAAPFRTTTFAMGSHHRIGARSPDCRGPGGRGVDQQDASRRMMLATPTGPAVPDSPAETPPFSPGKPPGRSRGCSSRRGSCGGTAGGSPRPGRTAPSPRSW